MSYAEVRVNEAPKVDTRRVLVRGRQSFVEPNLVDRTAFNLEALQKVGIFGAQRVGECINGSVKEASIPRG